MEVRGWRLILAAVAAGTCISLAVYRVYTFKKKKEVRQISHGADLKKVEVELTLDQGHLEWLQNCTETYSLASVDKALRILLTYAQQCVDEMSIFEEIRCTFCNDKQKVTTKHVIDNVHLKYLEEMVTQHKLASKDKAARIIIEYAMSSEDKAHIFEVKRCRHGDTCKNC